MLEALAAAADAGARAWERALASFLQHRLQLPDFLLIWIFHIGVLQLLCAAAALGLAPMAHR